MLDEVDIPGLPLEESERRRQWRKLPQRVRIGVRRLHHQFGHVPRKVLINLLRAATVHEEHLPPVPEEDNDIWQISPQIFGEIPENKRTG